MELHGRCLGIRHRGTAPAVGLAARFRQDAGAWQWREFIRVDNLANRRYAGSVIVNEVGGRFFETAARRSWLAGVELVRRFDR